LRPGSSRGSLISLAALLGSDVKDSAGSTVGRLRDIVVRWTKGGRTHL
jgi:sporulation protein YlmC with PRC-barrel domain